MYNTGRGGDGSGLPPGLHIRGPQLNPQRDPRWGRNTESPGEDAWLNGIYGAQLVRGGQGATVNGQYAGKFRKAVNEMVRTPSLHLRMKRATYLGSLQLALSVHVCANSRNTSRPIRWKSGAIHCGTPPTSACET